MGADDRRAAGAIEAGTAIASVVGLAARPRRGAVRLRLSPLQRDQVELLLGLLEPQADPLLVEQPEVAADRGIDQPQLVELPARARRSETRARGGLRRAPRSARPGVRAAVPAAWRTSSNRASTSSRLSSARSRTSSWRSIAWAWNAGHVLTQGDVHAPAVLPGPGRCGRSSGGCRRSGRTGARGRSGARRSGGRRFRPICATSAMRRRASWSTILIASSARIIRAATDPLSPRTVSSESRSLVDHHRVAVDVGREVLDLRLQLVVALVVLAGVVGLLAGGVEQLA